MLVFSPKYLFFFPGLVIFLFGLVFTVILLSKTIIIFDLPLGLSTAIFANACLLMGMQIMLFGIYAIILNSSRGLIESDRISTFFRKNFSLERGLILGGVIFGLGIAMGLITLILFVKFALNAPVHIPLTKLAIVSMFIVLLGIQIMFSSFYISLFDTTKTLG
ncbi:hypothetical protein ES708_31822 [subsurface metagenome]